MGRRVERGVCCLGEVPSDFSGARLETMECLEVMLLICCISLCLILIIGKLGMIITQKVGMINKCKDNRLQEDKRR